MSSKTFNNTKINVEFDEDYQSRTNINSGENISSLFAKIRRFILDLKAVCFSGSYNDLSDTPDVVTKEYVDPVKSQAAINRTTLGTQCKNLLKNTASTTTVNNVTFTVNSDGSITAKQTTTSPGNAIIKVATMTLKPGTYILTGDDEIRLPGFGAIRFYVGNTIYSSNKPHTFDTEVTIDVRLFVWQGVNINGSKTIYPMLRYADITDDTYEPYKENIDERLIQNKSDIAVNKTTLGTQCKNLLKNNAVTKTVNGITFTVNDDKSVTLNGTSTAQADFYLRGAWGSTSEILQKNKYIASIGVSQSSTFNGVVMHCINNTTLIGSPSCNYPSLAVNSAITAVYISVSKGYTFSNYKLYPMIRYADITDDTYEPYQPSLKEQVPYSISLPSKSTSESYSYNGVPTMICLTPSESVSSGGGLYLINSVGTAVYLIDKTGIVINTDTTNKTFTITNNTASTYDVYISCAYKKE